MVAPSNPNLSQYYQSQQPQPKKSRKLLIFSIIAIVLVIIIVIIVLIFAPNSTPTDTPTKQTDEADIIYGVPLSSAEEDLYAYFLSVVEDPDYQPNFSAGATIYSELPDDFTCDRLVKVSKMDLTLLNIHLDYGFVVAVSNNDTTTIIYGANINNGTYKTAKLLRCNPNGATFSNYTTANSTELSNILSTNSQYYIWIDESRLSSEG